MVLKGLLGIRRRLGRVLLAGHLGLHICTWEVVNGELHREVLAPIRWTNVNINTALEARDPLRPCYI